eukprot:COSAG06_NODE_3872_length_4815_cov_3.210560_2_plen_162_part_00
MGARALSKQDRTKILAYYKAANKGAKAFNEQEILDELPPALGGDVCKALYGDVLSGLPIFRNLGTEVMTHLCRTVHPMTALRGQVIMEQDKIGTEIYFITDGEVEVIQDDERLGFLGCEHTQKTLPNCPPPHLLLLLLLLFVYLCVCVCVCGLGWAQTSAC